MIKGIKIDPQIMSGVPVIMNTRFPVAQLLAEMAEGRTVKEIADDFDLPFGDCINAIDELSIYLNKPFNSGTYEVADSE